MKDLDFDELDRAVSTLMGNVTNTVEPAKQDDTKTLTITTTLVNDKPPVFPVGEVTSTPELVGVSSATPVKVSRPLTNERPAPLAARRSGRFMDVVTPSSTTRRNTPSQGVSRQGVSLAPVSGAEEVASTPASVPSDDAIETPASPSPVSKTSEWPDPLEFNQATQDGSDNDATPAEPVATQTNDATEPLNSPFLTDAKVEKRPLGTPAPELYAPLPPETEVADVPAEVEEVTEETHDKASVSVLPEELQDDLMAIEAGISEASSATPEPQETPEAPTGAPKQERQMDAPKAASMTPAPAVAVPMSTGSIPQQYREEPSTSDQTTGSIYDTASYHQPLDHPAKKKTGWLWVLWVVILLILGAGGGALAYLYLLQ